MIVRRHFARFLAGFALSPAPTLFAGSPRQPLAPIHPVQETDDPIAAVFLKAMSKGHSIPLFYLGGSTPGALRRFKPNTLYRLSPGGPIFASGICQWRQGTRTLRLDRVRLA